jgi:hypothetical protein
MKALGRLGAALCVSAVCAIVLVVPAAQAAANDASQPWVYFDRDAPIVASPVGLDTNTILGYAGMVNGGSSIDGGSRLALSRDAGLTWTSHPTTPYFVGGGVQAVAIGKVDSNHAVVAIAQPRGVHVSTVDVTNPSVPTATSDIPDLANYPDYYLANSVKAAYGAGVTHIVVGNQYLRSTDGANWAVAPIVSTTAVPLAPYIDLPKGVGLAVHGQQVALAWASTPTDVAGHAERIWIKTSNDAGLTWSNPQVLADGLTGADNNISVAVSGPGLTYDRTGTLWASWALSHNPNGADPRTIHVSSSPDNGATWNTAEKVATSYGRDEPTLSVHPILGLVVGRENSAIYARSNGTWQQVSDVVRGQPIATGNRLVVLRSRYSLPSGTTVGFLKGVPGVPGAPPAVSAAAGNYSATVYWSAPADKGNPVTEYTVTASPGGARTTTSGGTTATVTGLSIGTAYTFTVTATNAVGIGPASTASDPVTPPDYIERYVIRVYNDLLHRSPEAEGLGTWATALKQGTPYEQVANSITASPEFRGRLITDSYRRYLARDADSAGLQSWLQAMNRGLHFEQMEAGFIASPEFYLRAGSDDRRWVADLYQSVLNRTAASSEIDHWQGRLRAGATRNEVALGFLYSTEHLTSVVDGYYQRLLLRSIDPSGRVGWVSAIQNGARDEQIIAGVVASQEYQGKA